MVYRGEDERIHELSLPRTGPPWELADLTELTGAPEAAGDPAAYLTDFDDTARVVYRGADGTSTTVAAPLRGLEWRHGDLTELDRAPKAAGDPAAYLTDFGHCPGGLPRRGRAHPRTVVRFNPAMGPRRPDPASPDSAAVGQIVPHATGHPVAHITDF